ncbi:hypothetical protein MUO14_08940 [Halobacillus shinanisalinarum]|uniref:DUF4181 domain-containing protein n=1 Tax=Halobacillus shinanisalinarum TaxID=2932258 RepID=A0ABY4H7T2_9BACI|nr:hypothetical protein [Halobacillus shinanisalinarum]UOQ95032.1 hypothetical protein MUO14_08940 [Halobacillus shinanisalinarum]
MKHPYEQYYKLHLATLLVAVVLAIVALFNLGHQWIILFMFYILAAGLAIEAFIELKKQQLVSCISQLLRAIVLFIFVTILYF